MKIVHLHLLPYQFDNNYYYLKIFEFYYYLNVLFLKLYQIRIVRWDYQLILDTHAVPEYQDIVDYLDIILLRGWSVFKNI